MTALRYCQAQQSFEVLLTVVGVVALFMAGSLLMSPGTVLVELLQLLLGVMATFTCLNYYRTLVPLRRQLGLGRSRPLAFIVLAALSLGLLLSSLLASYGFALFSGSGTSMSPTILHRDVLVIWRSAYGIPHPFRPGYLNDYAPKRGDLVALRFRDKLGLSKRVIGVPGDTVEVFGDHVMVNGARIAVGAPRSIGVHAMTGGPSLNLTPASRFVTESLDTVRYDTLVQPGVDALVAPPDVITADPGRFPCSYSPSVLRCRVPARAVFVMGDNRTVSLDSRTFGVIYVSEIKGRFVAHLSGNSASWFSWSLL